MSLCLSYQHLPAAVVLCQARPVVRGSRGRAGSAVLSFQESAPFAVIGSNTVVEAKGQRVRGRLYPWGIVEGKHGAWERCEGGQAGMGQGQTAISNRDGRGELGLPPLAHGRGRGRVQTETPGLAQEVCVSGSISITLPLQMRKRGSSVNR